MDYPTIIIIIVAIGVFLILRWFLRQLFQKYVSLRYPQINAATTQQNTNRPFTIEASNNIEAGRSNMQVCNAIYYLYYFVQPEYVYFSPN